VKNDVERSVQKAKFDITALGKRYLSVLIQQI
jgi:hypothetical protein